MSEMIERVARAMHAARDYDGDTAWDDMPTAYREKSLQLVRVGVEAMREPTDEMRIPSYTIQLIWPKRQQVYRDMIDAALNTNIGR